MKAFHFKNILEVFHFKDRLKVFFFYHFKDRMDVLRFKIGQSFSFQGILDFFETGSIHSRKEWKYFISRTDCRGVGGGG